jgi:hypothetical protein
VLSFPMNPIDPLTISIITTINLCSLHSHIFFPINYNFCVWRESNSNLFDVCDVCQLLIFSFLFLCNVTATTVIFNFSLYTLKCTTLVSYFFAQTVQGEAVDWKIFEAIIFHWLHIFIRSWHTYWYWHWLHVEKL